eukprot:2333881-Rhodomonas_salina.3
MLTRYHCRTLCRGHQAENYWLLLCQARRSRCVTRFVPIRHALAMALGHAVKPEASFSCIILDFNSTMLGPWTCPGVSSRKKLRGCLKVSKTPFLW